MLVDTLDCVIQQTPEGQQHFLAGSAAMLHKFGWEQPNDTFAHLVAGSAHVLTHIFGDMFLTLVSPKLAVAP